jgi:hypothetical protein
VPSADPGPAGTRAVTAGPIGASRAADATFSGPDDTARTTATDPPAPASASADAMSTPFDLVSTAPG